MVHSREPEPFTSGIPIVPKDVDGIGNEHKKVSVVGCGQVGMAIAVSARVHAFGMFNFKPVQQNAHTVRDSQSSYSWYDRPGGHEW